MPENDLLRANNATRVRSRDMFMLMALWMERYPIHGTKTLEAVRSTGCVLVDQRDRIIALEHTGETHSIVRAILKAPIDPQGCDIYVSRFPCSLCTKMMVQAGIRKIYYFPAKEMEMDWKEYCSCQDMNGKSVSPTRNPDMTLQQRILEKQECNMNSVSRLIANNPIAMSKYIPLWSDIANVEHVSTTTFTLWELDDENKLFVNKHYQYPDFLSKFDATIKALSLLQLRYQHDPIQKIGNDELGDSLLYQHAIVLAHIAAKRTDDPKVGVGAVLVYKDGTYGSVGWNGYPKKADVLDYPQAGADDFIEQELKYDYILHAEQNALLWRMRPSTSLEGATIVSTKMPCDECSPVMYDCGIRRVVANTQVPKSFDDPARLRGLTYEKIGKLIPNIWEF